MAAENRAMLVGLLKFLVFILCVVVIPLAVPYFLNVGNGTDAQLTLCLISWVIALILQWAIGKVLDPWVKQQNTPAPFPPPSMGYANPPPGPQYPPQPGYPPHPGYTDQYQPPPASSDGSYGMAVNEPNVPVGPGPIYYQGGTATNPQGVFQEHVCKRCGGPVNLTTRKCEMCGARN
jgi:hypothetical protein